MYTNIFCKRLPQQETEDTNCQEEMTIVVVDGSSEAATSPGHQSLKDRVFIGGSETPIMYRSKEKLRRVATGRLYSPEEAEALGREIEKSPSTPFNLYGLLSKNAINHFFVFCQ